MGRRSASETTIAIMAAFVAKSSWNQAELARHLSVTPRTIRKHLEELARHGVRVERFAESERDIVWSVPRGWLPEVVALAENDAEECVRLLARLQKSELRDRIIRQLVGPAALARARADAEGAPTILAQLEDALGKRQALYMLYESETGMRWRYRSIHHIQHGDRTRFVAMVHERRELAWFRVERVLRLQVTGAEPFQPCDPALLDTFIKTSANGFHRGPTERSRFWVDASEARWVRANLPVQGATFRERDGGLEIEVETAGTTVLARFVVGLGSSARALSPALEEQVVRLARGALSSHANQKTTPASSTLPNSAPPRS